MSLDRRQLLQRGALGAVAATLPLDGAACADIPRRAARALREAVRGPVFFPRSPGYGAHRRVYNSRFDHLRPRAVVQPLDGRDVRALVRWARRFGVRLVARSGGHGYGGYSTTEDGVVVDLSRMRGIGVAAGRVTVGAGAQLIDLYAALSARGLHLPAGSCPSVGIAGLALGGGHGLSGRRFGLTSDNLRAATIVTADGRLRQLDARSEQDLFWACRGGGGGNFGIVTSLTFRTHRAGGAAWFFIRFPWEQADEALDVWQRFAPQAPPALTSILSLSTSGGSAAPSVTALGQYFGSERALRALVRPLMRVAGAGLSSGSASMMSLALRWAGCLDQGLSGCHTRGSRPGGRLERAAFHARSDYFDRPLPAPARRAMLGSIERRQRTPALGSGFLLLDAYGGALNRPAPDHTAFVHRDMLFSLQYGAYFGGAAAGRASRAWINGAWGALRPWASGQAYQNYIDPQLRGWQRAYYGDNLARLREIKKSVDPDFAFRFRQAIPPAS